MEADLITEADTAELQSSRAMESIAMNGGLGPESYAQNSSYQESGLAPALAMIEEAIAADMEYMTAHFPAFTSGEPFRIADLGCSVGSNTFVVVGGIIDTILSNLEQYYSPGDSPEFQVFFNDTASNDFNTLVRSPRWQVARYFAAAVPGTFHGRLFPTSSLHFVHSSYAIQWLSRVPAAVVDEKSQAWNKGKIMFLGARAEVLEAFRGQFAMDMDSFLRARAEEVVPGGLMALVFPFSGAHRLSIDHPPPPLILLLLHLLESALSDMVAMGRVEEYEMDCFNLNFYLPTMEEFKALVSRNGSFSIEKMQPLTSSFQMAFDARALSAIVRAFTEWAISTHFGSEIGEEIFDRHCQKIEESSHLVRSCNGLRQELFLLLKRRPT
ncbi:hypothetical protein H6P81_009003 [Aristolochia fimbriata]|uniref:S-adenosylmethionine-dependent methyltransferase n=1 Tax=Aristolochia fimbriata TaxID=158543 RepID=A0AAV7EJU3_ARIFI|nr:hypothetical protein H6P81_009003 [Aristolochia fimbriata]